MRELRNAAARLEAQRVVLGLLDAQTVRAEEPHLSHDVVGGLVVPSHGFVAAGELIRALAGAARRHGAQVIEGSRVRRIVVGEAAISPSKPIADRSPDRRSCWRRGAGPGSIEIAGLARAACRCVPSAVSSCGWRGKGRCFAAWSGAIAAIWCRGTTARCSSARRWRMRGSTSGRRLRACEICSRRRARSLPGAWTAAFRRRARGLAPGERRPAADHRGVAGPSEPDVRDGSLSERHSAGAR